MSNDTNTGGPAFARPSSPMHEYGAYKPQDGMNLRDYFAAKAIQGLLAGFTEGVPPSDMTAVAAYSYADAMLKAREQ